MISAASPKKPAFIFIFMTVLLDVISMGIVTPVLPRLVLEFQGDDFASSAHVIGIFLSTWALMQFLASPVIGAFSDHFGRRPIILISNFVLAVDHLIMALAPALWVLFVGRVLSGICSATVATAYAYIADTTSENGRARAYSALSIAFGLGFVLGPALGGLLGQIDIRLPFYAAAALGFANFVYGFFVLPESLASSLRAKFAIRTANPFISLKLLGRSKQLSRLGILSFILNTAQQVLPACAVLYMTYRYNWDGKQIGLALATVGVVYIVIQAGVMRPLAQRISEKTLAAVGFSMGLIGFCAYGSASIGFMFLLAIPIMEMWSLAQPSIYALMTKEVDVNEQGRLQGANACVLGLAGFFGPWAFAKLFSVGVDPDLGINLPGLPFFAAAVLLLFGLITVFQLKSRDSRSVETLTQM